MKPVSVAIIEGVVPSYRLQFLSKLGLCKSLRTVCFHGTGKAGHSVTSVGRKLPVHSKPIRNFHWPGGGARVAWQTGLYPIVSGRYDVVICAEAVHNLSTWLVLLCSRISRYAVVLSGHGLGTVPRKNGFLNRWRWRLRRFLAQKADALLVYTEAGAANCTDHNIDANKIFISGNTLDTEHLIKIADEVKAGRNQTPEPRKPNHINLIYVGRLYSAKRVDVLLAAAKLLKERGVSCRIVIVGDGHQKAELEAMEAADCVEFLGACYEERALALHFANADLLVIPDSVGLVVVHAFCNGTPIVTSLAGTGHGPEFNYIKDGSNGVLLHTLLPSEFADQLEKLASNPCLIEELGEEAKKTAQSLSMNKMVSQFQMAMEYATSRAQGSSE